MRAHPEDLEDWQLLLPWASLCRCIGRVDILLSWNWTSSAYGIKPSLPSFTYFYLHSSVERIDQYLELPQEPPAIIESNEPPAYWPSTSSLSPTDNFISVENLVIKYSHNLRPVLHGVSFKIKSKERVALVGRTGSGKMGSW